MLTDSGRKVLFLLVGLLAPTKAVVPVFNAGCLREPFRSRLVSCHD